MKKAYVAIAMLLAVGCETDGAYLYLVNQYEPTLGCLDGTSSLDVLAGADPGTGCSPRCIAAGIDVDGDIVIFASTMCGPPPVGTDVSGSNVLCPAALAALARSDICLDGGGSTDPLDASGQ